MKTFSLTLISPEKITKGCIRLIDVGKEAVRKGLIEGGGAKVVRSECAPGEIGPLADAVIVYRFSLCFHFKIRYTDTLT